MFMTKIFKNRIFIVIICAIIALVCIMAYASTVKSEAKKITVVRVVTPIAKGDQITKDMVETVTVGGFNLETSVIKSKDDVVGKYATADFVNGDYILTGKVSSTVPNANDKLTKLDGSRVAFSISIKDFSDALSDKLVSGDIVSVIASQKGTTAIPPQLTYVEVLAVTTGKGVDKQSTAKGKEEQDTLKTVTLLVTPEQAVQLANYDDNAEIHLALVYRGDPNNAKKFLDMQSEVLKNGKTDSSNR
jgi:pilus assembly protein CpaB